MRLLKLLFTFLLLSVGVMHLFAQEQKISLEEIYLKPIFRQKSFSGIINLSDGRYFAQIQPDNSIFYYDYEKGELKGTILTSEIFKANFGENESIGELIFSPDESTLLIAVNSESIYRHTSVSNYYIFDRKLQLFSPLDVNGKQMAAKYSPDGNKIAYVRDNNLFVKFLNTGNSTQITTDGKRTEIINGMPDWVYEEEFSTSNSFEWSASGNKLAYIKYNETRVKEYTLINYGKTYPEVFKYKYPKPGEDNSIISVHIFDVNTNSALTADIGSDSDIYIPRIKWMKSSENLAITRLNRLQNKVEILSTNGNTGFSKVILTEEDKCYINQNLDLHFITGDNFFRLTEKSGFSHISYYDNEGKVLNEVTSGNCEVNALLGIEEVYKVVYYSSNERSVLGKDIYSINFDGSNKKLLSPKAGTNIARFNTDFSYFINYNTNANTPLNITLNDKTGNELRVIEDNFKLRTLIKEREFVKKEFFSFKTQDGISLNGWIMKPHILDEGKKYPVLMYVYGGPGSQSVLDAWGGYDYIWYQYLVQNGYVIACVDNRGTGGRGADFERLAYLNLGKYELNDQIEAAKYLGSLSYIDKDRFGIFGWSYGGYMAALCMTLGSPNFKLGLVVAPVTDWRYYDNIYTERYMRTPKENPDGYFNFSPLNFADKLSGKLFLAHGSEDDNVHPQNTYEFIDKLVLANKQFDLAIYTNKNHNISGGNTRYHLFSKMTDYLFKNL